MKREQILRASGCAALLLGFVPLLALCTALFGRSPADNLPRICWLLAAGLAGFYFHRLLIDRTALSLFLRGLCLAGTTALWGLAAALFTQGGWERLCLGAVFAAGHLWGSRFARRRFYELVGDRTFWKMLALYGVFLIIPAAVGHWFPIEYSQLLNAVCFLAFAALKLLLHNQSNIDDLTASRHYSLEYLPKRIRVYNVLLVLAVIAVIAALFAALYIFAPDLGDLWERFKAWLIGRLSSGPPEEAVQPPAAGMGGMPAALQGLGEQDGGIPWLGKLLQILFGGLLVAGVSAVVIYNRSSIAGGLRRLWRRLCELAAGLFRRAAHSPRREETADYTDYDQAVTMETGPEADPGARGRLRQWKKDCRRYQRMADSAEKYRAGYGLTVDGLALAGAGIRDADTPLEIAGKASGLLAEAGCREATDYYDLLRYGERAYQPGRAGVFDGVLAEIGALHKRHK